MTSTDKGVTWVGTSARAAGINGNAQNRSIRRYQQTPLQSILSSILYPPLQCSELRSFNGAIDGDQSKQSDFFNTLGAVYSSHAAAAALRRIRCALGRLAVEVRCARRPSHLRLHLRHLRLLHKKQARLIAGFLFDVDAKPKT